MTTAGVAERTYDFTVPGALASWRRLEHPGWPDRWHPVEQTSEGIIIRPHVSSWYEDIIGGLLFQDVEGDFSATARVKVTGINGAAPARSFSLGGLMVREEQEEIGKPSSENWLFITTGSADRRGEQQFEVKTTTKGISTLRTSPAPAGWLDLRIVRLRELFTMFQRPAGETAMQLVDQWVRPDLPSRLQVGLIAYTDFDSAGAVYPDVEAINAGHVPNGVEDLIMTVASVTIEPTTIERFGPDIGDFASLSDTKLQSMGA